MSSILLGTGLMLLVLFLILLIGINGASKKGKGNQVRTTPTRAPRVQYVAIPLLIEWMSPDVQVPFENAIVFLRGGNVSIGNQIFNRHEPIDIVVPGAQAQRKRNSDCLIVRSSGEPTEQYLFCYKYFVFRGFAWVNLKRRLS